MEPPRDKSCTQVVVFEALAENAILTAMGGVEGRDCGINGENKFKEKILERNNLNILNSKDVDFGKERQIRRSRWLGIVEVNDFGKRRVSWDCCKCDKQAVNWVAREAKFDLIDMMGMGPWPSEAHAPLLGNYKSYSGPILTSPSNYEAGDCSKHTQAEVAMAVS